MEFSTYKRNQSNFVLMGGDGEWQVGVHLAWLPICPLRPSQDPLQRPQEPSDNLSLRQELLNLIPDQRARSGHGARFSGAQEVAVFPLQDDTWVYFQEW